MKLVWSPEATEDLREVLRDSTGKDSLASAIDVVDKIVTLVGKQLQSDATKGNWSPVKDTRVLSITDTPFEVPFRTLPDRIEILRIFKSDEVYSDGYAYPPSRTGTPIEALCLHRDRKT